MKRILFVFSWLVVGGEETEIRLLAQHLNSDQYTLEVVACFRKAGMPEQTHEQLAALGIKVDTAPYTLSFEDTVKYLIHKIPNYDVIVACQAVPDIYPALEQIDSRNRPPLIEHGGLVSEALRCPKHFTTRYVGVCESIRAAAASMMTDRPHHALEIPSMVDLNEFNPGHRFAVRNEWGIPLDNPVVGWVGRLDRKKRVEDFIYAAACVNQRCPDVQFVIIGGADAFMPEYEAELLQLTVELGITSLVHFLGDQPDVPRLLSGLDIFVWLSRGEGMPHVIAEAGAANLPVIATRDNGSEQQITHNETGMFVPHESPSEVANTILKLVHDPLLRKRLGRNLRKKVETCYSAEVVVAQWKKLFETVCQESTT